MTSSILMINSSLKKLKVMQINQLFYVKKEQQN